MNTEQIKDMQLLYSAVYNEELREQFDEYNTAIYVEEWVNQLVEEGYDLSEYTWDDMVEIYNEQFTGKKKFTLGKKKTPEELARYVAALQTLQGNNQEPTTQSQSSGEPTRRRRTNLKDVEVREDIYDTILSHLIDEGYAESVEQAEVIMVNMSEDWRESIIGEAKVDDGKSENEKRQIRTARAGRAGVNIPNSSLHTGDVDRRAEHRETDDLNKDAKDIRRGRTNRPQFQGETGKERIAHVKKVKGYS